MQVGVVGDLQLLLLHASFSFFPRQKVRRKAPSCKNNTATNNYYMWCVQGSVWWWCGRQVCVKVCHVKRQREESGVVMTYIW